MKTHLTVLACAAWATVALSYASTASAIAVTQQAGSYASCSSYNRPEIQNICGYTLSYLQTMRFITTPCGYGGTLCSTDYGGVYVDGLYPVGRKVTWLVQQCAGWTSYGIGACAC